ncbi:hypothetical protein FOVG_19093 [Fusarium oxysporum f. sp. pisi HDV247]|uniref:Bul1 C-terminal domain-containing protein n=2 Tax=Fusarium oxysporum TaxID=5507 RepID=A0A420M9C0_FUSOX|nr:hypothetical protein FOVG_19093 [Fusarium oxysporum f. sp. pisi HDV247]KAH7460997.1 hypothetical protein FOMA001_g19389 [Fusarium oxysporum f. sp. matthiolae]RKK61959.1 hypothetical protein BFJ69_g17062 [Fusarium oxysporum]
MGEMGISKALSKLRNWRRACNLEIELNHHYQSKIYSSSSVVQGRLIISPSSNFDASSISVSLDGVTKIIATGQHITSTTAHRFLKIDVITPEIPELVSDTLKKDQVYTIPFHFILPDQLDSTICTHKVTTTSVGEQHLCLPPTMGGWDQEDMSPGAVEIEYAINACVKSSSPLDSRVSRDLTAKKAIRFVPKSVESPPLHVSLTSQRYKLQAAKCLRHNSFTQPFGTISAIATQPEAHRLHPYGAVIAPSFIDISLTFNPAKSGISPPQPNAVSLSARSYTWHQVYPYQVFPDLHERPSLKEPICATISVDVEYSKIAWLEHLSRSLEDENGENASPTFYSSTLRLPLSFSATTKTLLPTFYSCFVSRTYDVRLRLTFGKQDVTIVTPLQIIAEA